MAETAHIADDDDGIRLDRWFKRHYPTLTHGHLEKLLRTGQVQTPNTSPAAPPRDGTAVTMTVYG